MDCKHFEKWVLMERGCGGLQTPNKGMNTREALLTVAGELVFQVNAGNYLPNRFAFSNHNAQMLPVVGVTFVCIRGTAVIVGVAFSVVDVVGSNYFLNLLLVNVSALHTAARMFGVN